MRPRPAVALLAATLVVSLGAGLGVTAQAAPADQRIAADTRVARQALAAAQDLAAPGSTPTREATLVLRDLAQHRAELTGEERQAAEALLSRPTDGPDPDYPEDPSYDGETVLKACSPTQPVCLHWVEQGEHAATDPQYIADTLAALENVHAAFVAAGYRAPLPDDGLGGDNRMDVYLANVGTLGYYGYCTTDQQTFDSPSDHSVWAYCVLDNDYSPEEFGETNTPTQNMQVTAAHEYFHAVQFAYDLYEDGWLMEATATWAEDELYDDVNDNLFYLPEGPLGQPQIPLDKFVGLHQYGTWIFFRYLTERFTDTEGGMPTLVRDIWRRADSTQGAKKDAYSLEAITDELAERGTSFKKQFIAFTADNQHPATTYEEGAENGYPYPPYAFKLAQLTPKDNKVSWKTKLDHLSSATGAITANNMKHKKWKLKISVDMGPRSRGSAAVVQVYSFDGATSSSMKLNKKGKGSKVFGFSSTKVLAVEVTLVNASQRFNCGANGNSPYSCEGVPKDDNQAATLTAKAFRR